MGRKFVETFLQRVRFDIFPSWPILLHGLTPILDTDDDVVFFYVSCLLSTEEVWTFEWNPVDLLSWYSWVSFGILQSGSLLSLCWPLVLSTSSCVMTVLQDICHLMKTLRIHQHVSHSVPPWPSSRKKELFWVSSNIFCSLMWLESRLGIVYYESIKWELKRRLTYEYRYDERLKTKNEESTRLGDTGLVAVNYCVIAMLLLIYFIYYESTKRKLMTKYTCGCRWRLLINNEPAWKKKIDFTARTTVRQNARWRWYWREEG